MVELYSNSPTSYDSLIDTQVLQKIGVLGHLEDFWYSIRSSNMTLQCAYKLSVKFNDPYFFDEVCQEFIQAKGEQSFEDNLKILSFEFNVNLLDFNSTKKIFKEKVQSAIKLNERCVPIQLLSEIAEENKCKMSFNSEQLSNLKSCNLNLDQNSLENGDSQLIKQMNDFLSKNDGYFAIEQQFQP